MKLGQTIHAASGGGWRGLAMNLSPGDHLTTGGSPFDTVIAVPWDDVVADTDSIRSTGVYSYSQATVPIGGAGVVPAGMAGLWRISQNIEFHNTQGDQVNWSFLVVKNDFDWIVGPQPYDAPLLRIDSYPVAAFVLDLDVGDVIWSFIAAIDASDVVAGGTSNFLMEYLG